jgi:integrase
MCSSNRRRREAAGRSRCPLLSWQRCDRTARVSFRNGCSQGSRWMDLLGHSTIGMTLGTYSHVLPALQRDAANRMDELLAAR